MPPKIRLYILATIISPASFAQPTDCISEVAHCFQINPLIIRAIIFKESGNRRNVFNKNKNNTIDVGIMQINSLHFPSLMKMGISERQLRESSCINIFSGTWILKQRIQHHGYTWDSIGMYHSRTPYYHDKYVNGLISVITKKSNQIKNITIPYQEGIRDKFPCQ